MKKVLAVFREARFSPGYVDRDRAVLESVVRRLEGDVELTSESSLGHLGNYDVILSMGRLPRTLELLKEAEAGGCKVINSGYAVERCRRSSLETLMRKNKIPMPPPSGHDGYWLKRGDAAAQERDDVVYCADLSILEARKRQFADRGIYDCVVSSHIRGDLVKFYAVGDAFFRFYYSDDGLPSKFGNEALNGIPHHYLFDTKALQSDVNKVARLVGIQVYGGDAIVDERGHYYIIDFNDWPSFVLCRDEAAVEIAKLVEE
ncbi:hypothetical protein C7120_01055 [Prevotella sp. oral taxon 376]|uniref:hypothetical protein n=1 Tax=Prevotella sp. oral taxon 376 TaxID=712466 RepID=UPI000D1DF5F1|nr:hypothetical protein [Prevotella sp. oral taxon 376]PTL33250.1 hypothetical protein C7120_01055 [Prevotella sp. oral taxon 376]